MTAHSLLRAHRPVHTVRPADDAFPSPTRESPNALPRRGRNVAIVHDWCPAFGGGERVLAQLCRLFPDAEVFTLFDFLLSDIKEEFFSGIIFQTSVANRLPMVDKFYRTLFFFEQFDVKG